MLLQNGHYSRQPFNQQMYQKFFDNYLNTLDPARLYLTQQDVDMLQKKYASQFGDFLINEETEDLAEEIHGFFNERALHYIKYTEDRIKSMNNTMPNFNTKRSVPRSRKDIAWEKDAAALERVWDDQITDMLLSEELRRENLEKLAREKGEVYKDASPLNAHEKILARLKRLRTGILETDLQDMVSTLLNSISTVYDPHSSYMGARQQQRFLDMMKAELIGIGAQLQSDDDGSTKITGIIKGGPAEKSDLIELGDRIVAIDSKNAGEWTDILFMNLEKVIELIRGKVGEKLSLRIQRDGTGEEKIITLTRAKVPIADELANGKIIIDKAIDMEGNERSYRLGIITLPSFYLDIQQGKSSCASDVKLLLNRMIKEGVEGIIIDLRSNGGGSLEEVRKISGFFTGAGPVVQSKDSRGVIERHTVSGRPLFNGKLVILTNKLSASASEILAGAMVDYGRAVIVGDESTFGKGTVQRTYDIGGYLSVFSPRQGSGMLKMTMQKYYRVGGASTQLKGVPSDIVLPVVTAGFEIGEAEQDYAMPYDEIPKAPGYARNEQLDKVIPLLKQRSASRVAKDKDMQYMRDNITRFRERTLKNKTSLNKAARVAETEKLLAEKKAADAERSIRYAKMADEDKKNLTIYRLTLENVRKSELEIDIIGDDNEYIEREETQEEKLSKSPDYPSDLDPELRESIHILRDMIDLY